MLSSRRPISSAARSPTPAAAGCGTRAIPCSFARAVDDTIDEALRYYRSVVGDRTPAELQETYVRGGAALIEYLEGDEHFAFKILPWPDYYSSTAGARNDGMRHIVSQGGARQPPWPVPGAGSWTAGP